MALYHHVPVMLEESVAAWRGAAAAVASSCVRPRFYIDCTLGGGGHTAHLLRLDPDARILGLDKDAIAVSAATSHLDAAGLSARACILQSCYTSLPALLAKLPWPPAGQVDGIFADLGVSSPQLDDPARGFSFRMDGPLDMRFGADAATATAADLVNVLPEAQLAALFSGLGEEPCATEAARAIAARRGAQPFQTTVDLAQVLGKAIRSAQRARFRSVTTSRSHPATRCFQALRIAVNGELASVQRLLDVAPRLLAPGGRFAVLSFHSLEDRLVKDAFAALCGSSSSGGGPGRPRAGGGNFRGLRFGPGTVGSHFASATPEEVARNPRARSAKLRVVERALVADPT